MEDQPLMSSACKFIVARFSKLCDRQQSFKVQHRRLVCVIFSLSSDRRSVQMCAAASFLKKVVFPIFFLNTETVFVIKNVKALLVLSVEEENERKFFCGNLVN